MAPGLTKAGPGPFDYAIANGIQGEGHIPADLDKLLTTVRAEWKGFDPLSNEFKVSYTARLNEVIKSHGSIVLPTVVSIRPVLVSIDRADDNYYTVTSIRTYVSELNGEHFTSTKVESAAVVLSNSKLIRLTIVRPLRYPADVPQVQGEMDDWARATAQNSVPKSP